MFNFLNTFGFFSMKFCEKAANEKLKTKKKKTAFLNTELANCEI